MKMILVGLALVVPALFVACADGGERSNDAGMDGYLPADAHTDADEEESLLPYPIDCTSIPLPPERSFPFGYWSHVELPEATERSILETYCSMVPHEWETFFEEQTREAHKVSDDLEQYIRRWLGGEAPAEIPQDLLPDPLDGNEKIGKWTLLHEEEINPRAQWFIVPARENPTDFTGEVLHRANAEIHVTYLRTVFIAPFGSELLVEGDFPHARFMDYQIQEPFDPHFPVTGDLGQNEIPLVDVDIEPDEGHVNPFRTGSDRNAELRHYHVTFGLDAGNAVDLNPEAMRPPAFRAPGNYRVGGPMAASGPIGQGALVPSILWLRYYAPDRGAGPLGGVPLPRVLLRLETGEKFWIQGEITEMVRRSTCPVAARPTVPFDPPELIGPELGWYKMFGGYTIYAEGAGIQLVENGLGHIEDVRRGIRSKRRCYFNRGPEADPPGNLTPGTTLCKYVHYLSRPTAIGPGKVLVFTGRLPTTPRTRDGEPTMEAAELRYWSICHSGHGPHDRYRGVVYGCLMDDEIVVDRNRDYVIVLSRPENRPSNAVPECGVTWQARGPEEPQGTLIRWLNVYPDHAACPHTPTDELVPWSLGSWAEDIYNEDLIGKNTPGVMGPYHPLLYHPTSEEFEAMGCPPSVPPRE